MGSIFFMLEELKKFSEKLPSKWASVWPKISFFAFPLLSRGRDDRCCVVAFSRIALR